MKDNSLEKVTCPEFIVGKSYSEKKQSTYYAATNVG
jgi:hypothetical protein